MKHAKNIFIILTLVFISTIARGQNEGRLEDLYMQGKWTATCATEIVDQATLRNCELCSFEINANNKSRAESKDIEMNFQTDSITINQNGQVTTVPYKRNKDNHSFRFTLTNKQYNFRVFLYHKQRIIEDSDGLVLVLDKAK